METHIQYTVHYQLMSSRRKKRVSVSVTRAPDNTYREEGLMFCQGMRLSALCNCSAFKVLIHLKKKQKKQNKTTDRCDSLQRETQSVSLLRWNTVSFRATQPASAERSGFPRYVEWERCKEKDNAVCLFSPCFSSIELIIITWFWQLCGVWCSCLDVVSIQIALIS